MRLPVPSSLVRRSAACVIASTFACAAAWHVAARARQNRASARAPGRLNEGMGRRSVRGETRGSGKANRGSVIPKPPISAVYVHRIRTSGGRAGGRGAERRIQAGFDAACAWIAAQPAPNGPVMARHPADVAWLTGRPAVGIPDGGPAAIAAEVDRRRVAFLLVDDGRYARSPDNPLRAFIALPGRARKAWDDRSGVAIYAVAAP